MGKKSNLNNYLFPIYYWGFTFLNPIVSNAGHYSTIILLVFALIIFISWFFLILKKGALNKAVFVSFGFLLILLFDMLFRKNSQSYNYIYRYAYTGLLTILFVSVIDDSKQTLKLFSILSTCAFMLFFYDPFIDYAIFGDYMGYGFNLVLPSFIGMSVGFAHFKKKVLVLPLIVCLFMILVYANRSSFLAATVFILLYLLVMHKKKRKILGALIFIVLLMFVMFEQLVYLTMELLLKLEVSTYAITQFLRLMQNGNPAEFFSGRFTIWENAWNMFLLKPIFGHGVGYFHSVYESYPHNLFLDVLVTYGILGFIAIGTLIFLSLRKLIKYKKANRLLGLVFFCLWFPKLLFSVHFIGDMGFWAFIAYIFLYLKINPKEINLEEQNVA